MAYLRSMVFVLTVMLCLAAASAFASEELFDTATASIHMEQGISCLKAKDFDAAINAFDESAGIAPEAEAFYYLGYAYYMKSRKVDGESRNLSLENFKKAYEIDPNFSPTRYRVPEPALQLITELSTTEVPATPPPPEEPVETPPAAPTPVQPTP